MLELYTQNALPTQPWARAHVMVWGHWWHSRRSCRT